MATTEHSPDDAGTRALCGIHLEPSNPTMAYSRDIEFTLPEGTTGEGLRFAIDCATDAFIETICHWLPGATARRIGD